MEKTFYRRDIPDLSQVRRVNRLERDRYRSSRHRHDDENRFVDSRDI